MTVSGLAMNAHLKLRHTDEVTSLLIHLTLLTVLNGFGALLGTSLADVGSTLTHLCLLRLEAWELPAMLV